MDATQKVANQPIPKKVEIVRPRFCFGGHSMSKIRLGAVNDEVGGGSQPFDCIFAEGFRHISLAELDRLLVLEGNDLSQRQILAEIMLAYLLTRGIDLKEDDWTKGIWVCDGIQRYGNSVVIYKEIDGKIKSVGEDSFDTTVGHKFKEGPPSTHKYFGFSRTFKKYGEKDLTLRKINYYNPEFIEYLFPDREFEQLSSFMQSAIFILPPDLDEQKNKNQYKLEIWPLAVDFSFNFKQPSHSHSQNRYQEISKFICSKVSIYPHQVSCGIHVVVKEEEMP